MVDTKTIKQSILDLMASKGVTMTADFIPFSASRARGDKQPSLNWRVSLTRTGQSSPLLTTYYTAGCAHCPSFKHGPVTVYQDELVRKECETGMRQRAMSHGSMGVGKIDIDQADMLASLSMDAEAIDYPSFYDWASEFGYDVDSRKAELIYRNCLQTGLALRAALGEDGLRQLRDLANQL